MKINFTLILLFFSISLFSQDVYYWSGNNKIFLKKDTSIITYFESDFNLTKLNIFVNHKSNFQ
jgi:hypothetical protein